MRRFSDHNPIAVCVYYLCVTAPLMFCAQPVLLAVGLVTGGALLALTEEDLRLRSVWFYLAVPLASMILNPLFSHGGVTVLFVVNDRPITLEAAVYGLVMGGTISAVLLWFRSFSAVMTTDRLLYVFGAVSPKLALILSMTLRYIPLYRRQAARTRSARQAVGLMREDSIPDRLRSGMQVFSAMVTWALENGVITADSMTARGYGTGRRSRFTLFFWRREDWLLMALGLALALSLIPAGLGWVWLPAIQPPAPTLWNRLGTAEFAILAALPAFLEGKERLRWHFLRSKI